MLLSVEAVQDTLDAIMKNRTKIGMAVKNQADVISEQMENDLWTRGFLGDDNPHKLLDTLVFVLGLNLALRGREEHRRLRFQPSQIQVKTAGNGRRLVFTCCLKHCTNIGRNFALN